MKPLIPGLTSLILFSVFLSAVHAEDRIRTYDNQSIPVTITAMTPDVVSFNRSGMDDQKKVGEIDQITYEGEPAQFASARADIAAGRYQEARKLLQALNLAPTTREYIRAERDFLVAQATALFAFRGGDSSTSLKTAAADLENFNTKNTKYYRYYEAMQLLGDLYLQMSETDKAQTTFTKLASVKDAPMTQARGNLGLGKVLLAKGKAEGAKAEAAFKSVQSQLNKGEIKSDITNIQMSVTLGLAQCAAINGKFPEAKKLVQDVIDKLSPEDTKMNAQAYNTLGDALSQEGGKTKEAMIAYLHTHLLYNSDPITHYHAMAKLAVLFRTVDPGRAEQLDAERQKLYKK